MVKSWSGRVSLQCSTSKLILLVERRQSERSKDNTCDLGSTLEQLDPKVTTAGASTVTADALFEFSAFGLIGFVGSITGGDFLSIQSILRIAVTICFNFMFHVTEFWLSVFLLPSARNL
jgi:hypothetical protein